MQCQQDVSNGGLKTFNAAGRTCTSCLRYLEMMVRTLNKIETYHVSGVGMNLESSISFGGALGGQSPATEGLKCGTDGQTESCCALWLKHRPSGSWYQPACSATVPAMSNGTNGGLPGEIVVAGKAFFE